jgi:hypothetical protein
MTATRQDGTRPCQEAVDEGVGAEGFGFHDISLYMED